MNDLWIKATVGVLAGALFIALLVVIDRWRGQRYR